MSVEEQQLMQQIDELPYQSLKCQNQNTTIYIKQKNTYQSTVFDIQSYVQGSTDCSFEQAIHEQNIEILKNATVKYLEETITQDFNKTEGFKDPSLYESPPFQVGGENELDLLSLHNELLSEKEQKQLLKLLKDEEELVGLFKQVTPVFGITIGKELSFIIYHILKLKISGFRELKAPKDSILTRFDCFQGFEDEEQPFRTACPLYEDLNLEQIPLFAQKQMDQLCSMLYFSCQVKYLSLRQIKVDTKSNVYPTKFNALIKQISRTVFYSMAGAVEPTNNPCTSSIFALDLSREVSFSEFPEGNILSIQRSLSRPFVTFEDEQMDFLSKKLKFDQR